MLAVELWYGAWFFTPLWMTGAAALVGWMLMYLGVKERVTAAAFSFCLLNYAALVGAVLFLHGRLYLSEVRALNLWRKAA